MIEDIIDRYNVFINYDFKDLHLGVVHPILNKKQYIPGNRNGKGYVDAVPNDRRSCVLYWEDYGSRIITRHSRENRYMSTARLVCWLNMDKITNKTYKECLNDIWRSTPKFMPGDRSINFVKVSHLNKSIDIFSRYNYRESKQYITNPFDVFAIEFNIYYFINDLCL